MNFTPQLRALRDLFSAVDFTDRVQVLIIYTSVCALCEKLDADIASLSRDKRVDNANYLTEKLALFITYFSNAVIPTDGAGKPPEEWMDLASDNLMKVEQFS